MSLADQVLNNIKTKHTVARAAAFEYFYYQVKKMVKEPSLLDEGRVVYHNRIGLNGYLFTNKKTESRWSTLCVSRSQENYDISITLMK